MKKNFKNIFLFAISLFSCLTFASCQSLNGENGKDGKNVNINVGDDGYIYIDNEKTDYYFGKKDCKINVKVENNQYGTVEGEGNYTYGSSIYLTAKPNENGTFVGWKNENGKYISKEENLLVVADHGETTYFAEFACNPSVLNANINIKFDEITLPNCQYIGEDRVKLIDGITLKFTNYDELSLILYSLDKADYDLDYLNINEKISNNEIKSGKTISYEEYLSLYDSKKYYYDEDVDFYFYVVGKTNIKHVVNISSNDGKSRVLFENGKIASGSQEFLKGTVLKLQAESFKETINGSLFDASTFSFWSIDGIKVSTDKTLMHTVNKDVSIKAHFEVKTKLSLIIESGEEGLIKGRYSDFYDPEKAVGNVNGFNFDISLEYVDGKATITLGYFEESQLLNLQLKLYCSIKKWGPTTYENSWKYVDITYYYNNVKVGGGNSFMFFVPPSNEGVSTLNAKYIRTANYYSFAVNDKNENAKEILMGSGFGLID